MDERETEKHRRALIARGKALVRRRAHLLAGQQDLRAEHEADWEDQASSETSAELLATLSEHELAQLKRIQASLTRMEAGTYGRCIRCGGEIDSDRLRAVPEADRCSGCTNSV